MKSKATTLRAKRASARLNKELEKPMPISIVECEVDKFDSPESSKVHSATYNPTQNLLTIHFKNRPDFSVISATYKYREYPPGMWDLFKTAPSKGKFVLEYIVGPDRNNPIYKGVRV